MQACAAIVTRTSSSTSCPAHLAGECGDAGGALAKGGASGGREGCLAQAAAAAFDEGGLRHQPGDDEGGGENGEGEGHLLHLVAVRGHFKPPWQTSPRLRGCAPGLMVF